MGRRVFVLGLDSLPPRVLYGGLGGGLRYLRELVGEARRWVLRSCHPPITVPAWMVMFTGLTPGELGVYGFRHRRRGDYGYYIVDSSAFRGKTLWDEAGRRGLWVGLYGVPPTYPPYPVRGFMVTDFTTPGPEKPYTWPPWLRAELERYAGGPPVFDIVYRSHDKDRVAADLERMLLSHLRHVEYLATRKRWDLFVYVELAVDRAHHAFWRYFDPEHPRYERHPRYSRVIPWVYETLDRWFESLHRRLPRDTVVVVASDHGVKAMRGAFTINQWLAEQGYLRLRRPLESLKPGTELEEAVDWGRTVAWAWGGYYSRVFVNVRGRERHGVVEPRYYEDTVRQLKRELSSIRGPGGEEWRNLVYTPHELYPAVRGDAPDLMVYLDDLWWRPAGTLGWPTPYLPENDRGPDDAVHDWYGVFAVYDPEGTVGRGDAGILDIRDAYRVLRELLLSRA